MMKEDKYIDQHFHFKGKWDVHSLCGLKIVKQKDKTIVIATNLYKLNHGTSISRWAAPLATFICLEFDIEPDRLLFIERNPDRKSKLDFYKETFDMVKFNWEDDHFVNPIWTRVNKNEVDELLS